MPIQDIPSKLYKKARGNKKLFIQLLEEHGFKKGYNGYRIVGNDVYLYVGIRYGQETFCAYGLKE